MRRKNHAVKDKGEGKEGNVRSEGVGVFHTIVRRDWWVGRHVCSMNTTMMFCVLSVQWSMGKVVEYHAERVAEMRIFGYV